MILHALRYRVRKNLTRSLEPAQTNKVRSHIKVVWPGSYFYLCRLILQCKALSSKPCQKLKYGGVLQISKWIWTQKLAHNSNECRGGWGAFSGEIEYRLCKEQVMWLHKLHEWDLWTKTGRSGYLSFNQALN